MGKIGKYIGAGVLAAAISVSFSPAALAAANNADPNKVLRVAFPAADAGFDLIKTSNQYSNWVGEVIFETLLTYDYLAMPAKLIPKTAVAMPQAEDGGKTYTVHIRKGIYFTPDPAFNGKPRELTAEDYVYTFKRVLDPAVRSQVTNFLDGKLVGLDELAEAAKKTGKFDYDAKIPGIEALDRYTIRFRLKQQDYNFLFTLAYSGFGAMAREVVEKYGQDIGMHPVGTGPYMLEKYVPGSKVILKVNPDYPAFEWNFQAMTERDKKLAQQAKGKKFPQIGRVEVNIMEEEQPRWLAFQDKQIDLDMLPQAVAPGVMNGDKLKPEYAKQNIDLFRVTDPEITYWSFNLKDPVIGGYSKEKIALRRALGMVYSIDEEIEKVRKGQAVRAHQIVPVGILGHDPKYRSSNGYNIELANKLLDRFGYKRGADGFRMTPDGKPLTIEIRSEATSTSKIFQEIWKRGMDQVGLRGNFTTGNFPDNMKAAKECKIPIWGSAWGADIPDGENFVQLLYSRNINASNNSCYENEHYDKLYRQAIALPHGPERYKLYQEMNRQMEGDNPITLQTSRIRNWVIQPWVKGFKKHPILHGMWELLDIEKH
ncbi:ABC transporter substrate-binding protein [Massilia sp. W12]|uniref:ABC transporter substrate-binding protein n=1 Tax=Massilia sp. W12 TaxID=3126507 RepID=UPI0030D2E2EE